MSCSSVFEYRAVAASHLMSGDSILPASTTPYTLFPPPSHGSAFDGSSFDTRSTPINGLAPSPTDYQVWQRLKSLLEGYVNGDKLAFEKNFKFGQWTPGVHAQHRLEGLCFTGRTKLGLRIEGMQTLGFLIAGLIDLLCNVLKEAQVVNSEVLRCLITETDVQHDRESLPLDNEGRCTGRRLHKLRWNCRNQPEAYRCKCELKHEIVRPVAISPTACVQEMQRTFFGFRVHLYRELANYRSVRPTDTGNPSSLESGEVPSL
jgi:hypothetical protein